MKYKLYIAKNDGILHLLIKKNRKDVLLCNPAILANKHRIAKYYEDIWIIAPRPKQKNTCAKCVMANKKLMAKNLLGHGMFLRNQKMRKSY